MLDYGYRSKCCNAPIRLAVRVHRKSKLKVKVWQCTRCKKKDIDIIPTGTDSIQLEEENSPFLEE